MISVFFTPGQHQSDSHGLQVQGGGNCGLVGHLLVHFSASKNQRIGQGDAVFFGGAVAPYSYGHLPVISTYNPIYRMYNPTYNQL